MKLDAGRFIAYGGGGSLTTTSLVAKASPAMASAGYPPITPTPGDVVSLLNWPLIEVGAMQVVVADLVSVGGLTFVGVRLAFDIWKYFDSRRGARSNGDQ